MALSLLFAKTGMEYGDSPDLDYPDGVPVVDYATTCGFWRSCTIELPYPNYEVGAYLVRCDKCGVAFAVVVKARADDPRSVKIPCYFELPEDIGGNA